MLTNSYWIIAMLLIPVFTQIITPLLMLLIWLAMKPLIKVIARRSEENEDPTLQENENRHKSQYPDQCRLFPVAALGSRRGY